jgi:hypothetical protein
MRYQNGGDILSCPLEHVSPESSSRRKALFFQLPLDCYDSGILSVSDGTGCVSAFARVRRLWGGQSSPID